MKKRIKKTKKIAKKKTVRGKITKNMIIAEIITKYPKARKVFAEVGLMCALCGFSGQETLEQGAISHGFDIQKLLKKLNSAVK